MAFNVVTKRFAGQKDFRVEISKGLIESGQFSVHQLHKRWRYDHFLPGVVYCGGFSAGAYNMYGAFNRLDFGNAGYPMISGDIGDTPSVLGGTSATSNGGPGVWGNDASMTSLGLVFDYLENSLKAKTGKHVLMGGSHGGAAALRYAYMHPERVAGVVTFIGAADPEDIRANNRGPGSGYAASIQAAFGLSAGQSVPDSKNPRKLAATWPTSVPVRLYYSSDDPICVPATNTGFASDAVAAGADVVATSFGANAHTTNNLPWDTISLWAESKLLAV